MSKINSCNKTWHLFDGFQVLRCPSSRASRAAFQIRRPTSGTGTSGRRSWGCRTSRTRPRTLCSRREVTQPTFTVSWEILETDRFGFESVPSSPVAHLMKSLSPDCKDTSSTYRILKEVISAAIEFPITNATGPCAKTLFCRSCWYVPLVLF